MMRTAATVWPMTRREVPVDQLVGATEIAERLGHKPSLVHDWIARYPDFPEPVARLKAAHVGIGARSSVGPGRPAGWRSRTRYLYYRSMM